MVFVQKKFNEFVVENNIVGFFDKPITLKSGRISNWYVNWRNACEDAFLLDKLSDFVLSFVKQKRLNVNTFFGVPEGATKLAVICQFKMAKRDPRLKKGKYIVSMGRGKPKTHGELKDRFFLGVPQGRVVVIEDVTTTGSSLLNTIDFLKKSNINIVAAIGLTNRMEKTDTGKSVLQLVKQKKVKYYQMSSAIELIKEVNNSNPIKSETKQKLVEYFEKYGVKKLVF